MKKILFLLVPLLGIIIYASSGLIFFTLGENCRYSVYGSTYPTVEYNLTATEAYKICLFENEKGVSVKLNDKNGENLIKTLLAEEKFSEYCDGTILRYYHSPYLKKSVKVRGEIINLQIATSADGTVIAGTPLIMGSI